MARRRGAVLLRQPAEGWAGGATARTERHERQVLCTAGLYGGKERGHEAEVEGGGDEVALGRGKGRCLRPGIRQRHELLILHVQQCCCRHETRSATLGRSRLLSRHAGRLDRPAVPVMRQRQAAVNVLLAVASRDGTYVAADCLSADCCGRILPGLVHHRSQRFTQSHAQRWQQSWARHSRKSARADHGNSNIT